MWKFTIEYAGKSIGIRKMKEIYKMESLEAVFCDTIDLTERILQSFAAWILVTLVVQRALNNKLCWKNQAKEVHIPQKYKEKPKKIPEKSMTCTTENTMPADLRRHILHIICDNS